MNTSKRADASRANGARSHGPKTESGKQRSSMNSVRHSLLARCVLLKNESPEPFEQLCREFIDKLQPADNVELACVEEMAAATWRLRRVMAIETNLMNREIEKCTGGDEFLCVAESFSRLSAGTELALLDRYESRLHRLYQRSFRNLLHLRELNNELPREEPENTDSPNEPTVVQPPLDSIDCSTIQHATPASGHDDRASQSSLGENADGRITVYPAPDAPPTPHEPASAI